ncbi:MAG TPA: ABC transporter substrate-binding protein [Acidimicrobiales bacterium]
MRVISFCAATSVVLLGLVVVGGGGSSAGAASASPIKLLMSGAMSGTGQSDPEMESAVAARVSVVNASGGVNGHRISVVYCDDQGDVNDAATCAREAVSDHVVAVIDPYTQYANAITAILAPAKIAFVGDELISSADGTSPVAFPVDNVQLAQVAAAQQLVKDGCHKIGYLFLNVPPTEESYALVSKALDSSSTTVIPDEVDATTTDWSPAVESLFSKGAQCLGGSIAYPQSVQVLTAIQQIKPGTKYSSTQPPVGSDVKQAFFDNTVFAQSAVATNTTSDPDVKLFLKEMAKYAPKAPITKQALAAWADVKLLVGALGSIKGSISNVSVLKAMGSISKPATDVFGPDFKTTHPLPIAGFQRAFNTTIYLYHDVNGKYVPLGPPKNDEALLEKAVGK